MNIRFGAIALFLSSLLWSACKEQPVPIPDLKVGKRRVLIEQIRKSTGPENVVAITLYPGLYGILSRPYSTSRYDFRSPETDALVQYLGVADGIPALSVNRRKTTPLQPTAFILAKTQWSGVVRNELQKEPLVGIFLTIDYDEGRRTAGISVDMTAEKTLTGDHFLTVCITQDSVMDLQNDGGNPVADYPHRHVLRKFVTAPTGDRLTETLTVAALVNKQYSLRLPAEWAIEQCRVVAFVHRGGVPDFEVLQAAEKKIRP
jgi:Outer membrane protein Omp28